MKRKLLITIILAAFLIAACGSSGTPAAPTPDVAAVRTSAASTVVSQFTLTAAAFTPTLPPPIPTETSAPEQEATDTATAPSVAQATNTEELCDSLSYDLATVDVNVPDNSVMAPGQDFIKTWKVKNSGSCPWGADYKLVYAGYADKMSGQWQPFTEVVQPGQEVEVTVQFKAPDKVAEYVSAWQMQNPRGFTFPEAIYVKILVQ